MCKFVQQLTLKATSSHSCCVLLSQGHFTAPRHWSWNLPLSQPSTPQWNPDLENEGLGRRNGCQEVESGDGTLLVTSEGKQLWAVNVISPEAFCGLNTSGQEGGQSQG